VKNTKKKKLGERLVERGSVSSQDLEKALNEQQGKTILLGDLLLARGLVSRDDLAVTLKELLGIEYVDLSSVNIDPAALKLMTRAVAAEHLALPLYKEKNKLVVAMSNPQNMIFLERLRFRLGMDVAPVLSFSDEISAAIELWYSKSPKDGERTADTVPTAATSQPTASSRVPPSVSIGRTSMELSHQIVTADESQSIRFELAKAGPKETGRDIATEVELARHEQSSPAVRMFSSVIAKALSEKASDIHIDPQTSGSIVRLRVDGMLRDLMEVPHEIKGALISRIKILADMDIADRRAPQDGRIMVMAGERKIDLRVSTLPTQHGEKTVIRLLDPESAQVNFAALGLSESAANALRKVLGQPQGMLLVTGPTGAGKTTTLYAALNQIRSRTKNIITVEDPVEYMLDGVNQVQVNVKASRTFESCLRSILRQDPNVIWFSQRSIQMTVSPLLRDSWTWACRVT
jgi:type IV pilus assembly protein PilB